MKVNFKFDLEQETREILWIYREYGFFKENKYQVFYPKLSDKLEAELTEHSLATDSVSQFTEEFSVQFQSSVKLYQSAIKRTQENWRKIEKDFFNKLSQLSLCPLDEYTCFVSRYGPGGSYYPPDEISIRVRNELQSDIENACEKIAHEIVHLLIDSAVKKYQIGFEDTERIVDLYLTNTPISKLLANPTVQGFGDSILDQCLNINRFDLNKTLRDLIQERPQGG